LSYFKNIFFTSLSERESKFKEFHKRQREGDIPELFPGNTLCRVKYRKNPDKIILVEHIELFPEIQ